jgi:hypothetical protein
MLESSVGASICASLATLPGFTYPADIFPTAKFYAHDAGGVEVQLGEKYLLDVKRLWSAACEPNVDGIDKVTSARAIVGGAL